MISFEYFTTVKNNFFIPLPMTTTNLSNSDPLCCTCSSFPIPTTDFLIDFLKSSFRFTAKLRDLPYATYPYICLASPVFNIFHQSGSFATIDEPTLTYH